MFEPPALWSLTVEDDDPGEPRRVALRGDVLVVGRDPRSDLCLPERNVSRRHAELRRDAKGRWHVHDCASDNGSYVNGRRVEGPEALDEGSCLQIGDVVLTLGRKGATRGEGVGAAAVAWAPPAADDLPHRLLVVQGPHAGRAIRLDRGPVTLGGTERCGARFEEPGFGELEIVVRPLAGGHYEVLNRGALPMRVGLRITGRALLGDGDLIWFAGDGRDLLLELRYLAEGKGLPTYPGTPVPVRPLPERPRAPGPGAPAAEPVAAGLERAKARRVATRAAVGAALVLGAAALAKAHPWARARADGAPAGGRKGDAVTAVGFGGGAVPAGHLAATPSAADAAGGVLPALASTNVPPAFAPPDAPPAVIAARGEPAPKVAARSTAGRRAEGASSAGERDASGPGGERALKARLEQRAASGGASPAELRQLRSLCARLRDQACYARAQALLDGAEPTNP